jgi:hypothetical protein
MIRINNYVLHLRYLLTYTIALATSNVEGLPFSSTRIAHQDNSGNQFSKMSKQK